MLSALLAIVACGKNDRDCTSTQSTRRVDLGEVHSMALDAAGNVFVAGSIYRHSDGTSASFVIKYDSRGEKQWSRMLDDRWSGSPRVATDRAGNAFVAGSTLTSLDGNILDLAVEKYDPSGTRQWTRQLGSSALDSGNSIATDADGNVLVAGRTDGSLDGNASAGDSDAYVVKYDAFGTKLWSHQFGSPSNDQALSVATDGAGNVLVTGFTYGALDGNSSAGRYDAFVVKYDPSGARQWTRQLGSQGDAVGFSVATDGTGNVLVAGYMDGMLDGTPSAGPRDAFVVKYDPSGARQWTRQLGSPGDDVGRSVATDGAGNVFVAGQTEGSLDGSSSAGSVDAFVVGYDASGTLWWTRQFGSPAREYGSSVATDGAGNVFVAGYTVQYPETMEAFVAKFSLSCP